MAAEEPESKRQALSQPGSDNDAGIEFDGVTEPAFTPAAALRSHPPSARHRGHMCSCSAAYIEVLPQEAKALLESVFSCGLHVSTHFTGLGFWDIAVACTAQSASPDATVDIFHQCDIASRSLKVLLKHAGTSRGRHIFIGVEGGWPDETISELKKINARFVKLIDSAAEDGVRETLGREMLDAFLEILDASEQRDTDFCMVHQRQCKLCDIDVEAIRAKGGTIGSLASPPCVDYSVMNRSRPGAMGNTQIAFACYLADRKRKHALGIEDFSLMEITPRHPSCELYSLAMKSNLNLSWVICPTMLSIPNTRRRRFTLSLSPRMIPVQVPRCQLHFPGSMPQASGQAAVHSEAVNVVDSSDEEHAEPFVQLRVAGGPVAFFGSGVLENITGSVWYFASPAYVEKFYDRLRAGKNIPKGVGKREWLLEPFSRSNLGRFRQSLEVPAVGPISS